MTTKYLQYFPKPLLDDLVKGRWLPVIGAGMSMNAILPSGMKMPLWGDLSKVLADELIDFSSTSVLDAISAHEHEFGRARLIERLIDILHLKEAQPGDAHKEFCTIPFDIVCTTNFDFMLERQYEATPHFVYPVVDEEQLSINVSSPGTLLLKLHGDLRHPSRLIVTEGDYDGFLAQYPLLATYLANLLITKTAVFVGYSLDDPDFRQIWHVVSDRLGSTRRMAYAIAVGARPTDIARFERRGVKVINLPGNRDRYGEVLATTFRELREYWRDNIISVSKVTEEEPLSELLLPRGTNTRLCFFSLPLDLMPFYRQRVFPAVEETGFVPVTTEEIVSPGDNVSAKIDVLIDRAAVMIVDISSRWTFAELQMAIARLKGAEAQLDRHKTADAPLDQRAALHLIVVVPADSDEALPATIRDLPKLYRPNVLSDDTDTFVYELRAHLNEIAQEIGYRRNEEPRRLYEAKEYRAAVIAAMTFLETTLRERLDKAPWPDTRRPMSLQTLIGRSIEAQEIPGNSREQFQKWMRIRNEAVHSARPVSRSEAREIVQGVGRLLDLEWSVKA